MSAVNLNLSVVCLRVCPFVRYILRLSVCPSVCLSASHLSYSSLLPPTASQPTRLSQSFTSVWPSVHPSFFLLFFPSFRQFFPSLPFYSILIQVEYLHELIFLPNTTALDLNQLKNKLDSEDGSRFPFKPGQRRENKESWSEEKGENRERKERKK